MDFIAGNMEKPVSAGDEILQGWRLRWRVASFAGPKQVETSLPRLFTNVRRGL